MSPLRMHQIRRIIELYGQVRGIRESQRLTGLSRNTIREYLRRIQESGMSPQVAEHYSTTILAARVRKPRDKGSVEKAVNLAYQRIYAPLRNQVFYSLEDLNAGLRKQLELSNQRPMKGKVGTRRDLFEADEKPLLKTLPATGYEIKYVTKSKVQRNYHVILGEDRHQYSVPQTLIGKRLKIIYTTETVEIYDGLKRVVIHKRNYKKMDYTTLSEHMPAHHQHVHQQRGWDGNYFKEQALCVGPATLKVIERILTSRSFHEQTSTSCLRVLRLGKKYGNDRLEAACLRSAPSPLVNYTIIANILLNNLDKVRQTGDQLPLYAEPATD